MKADWTEINKHRIRTGTMASTDDAGRHGAFYLRLGRNEIIIIATDGAETGWEHVSARVRQADLKERVPTWEEMCWLKQMFWDDEECVVQFHPPKSQYVNNHPHVLHLWKAVAQPMPSPDPMLVGYVTK